MTGSLSERNELDDIRQQNAGGTGMIKTELIVVDGFQLRRTWSDTGFMIERDGAVCTQRQICPWNMKARTRSSVLVKES